jgi:hypothetical protein
MNKEKEKIKELLKTKNFTNIELAYQLGKASNIDVNSIAKDFYKVILKINKVKSFSIKEKILNSLKLNPIDIVHNYPTEHKMGFNEKEIKELLDYFLDINRDKFIEALRGNTCTLNDKNKIIMYHHDISTAVKCGLENRDRTFSEWD